MVPYILTPAIVMTVQYIGTVIRLFPLQNYIVPWTTPFFISGILTTQSFMGFVMHAILFAVAFICWLPYIKIWDDRCYKQEQQEA
jgi:PTS system cellobiose-specific IIC component